MNRVDFGGFREQASEVAKKTYQWRSVPFHANPLFIMTLIHEAVKSFFTAMAHGDREELSLTSARLLMISPRIVQGIGNILLYLPSLGMISKIAPAISIIPSYIGAGLCIAEGAVDAWLFNEQRKFTQEYDFKVLSHLRYMIGDYDPVHAPAAIKWLAENRTEPVFSKMKQFLDEYPLRANEIITENEEELEKIAERLLKKDLGKLQTNYLELSAEEVREIGAENKEQLSIQLGIKKKWLARRLRPWMVREANEKVLPILYGLDHGLRKEAIKEGLRLSDDIHAQAKKKQLAHTMGVIAMIAATVGLVCVAVALPPSIPYLFALIAATFSFARMGVFNGMLETRGWSLSPKYFIPEFIRNRIFTPPEAPPDETFRLLARALESAHTEFLVSQVPANRQSSTHQATQSSNEETAGSLFDPEVVPLHPPSSLEHSPLQVAV